MADLQKQLQDHARQLALLSQQLQNMESLLLHHDEPFPKVPEGSPRLVASPSRSCGTAPALFMATHQAHHALQREDRKSHSKNQDMTPASCSGTDRTDRTNHTDAEIQQARWEAIVNMIEVEEHCRARDVAELRQLIEQSHLDQQSALAELAKSVETSGDKASFRHHAQGLLDEVMARLSSQETQMSQVQASLASPEKTFKGIMDELQVTRDEATHSLRKMSSKLMEDFERKLEALKTLLTTLPEQSAEGVKLAGAQVSGALSGRTISRERLPDSRDGMTASARAFGQSVSGAPISKQAYASLGQTQPKATKKAHSIQIPMMEGVVAPPLPKRQNQTSNVALSPAAACCMDGSCGSCASCAACGRVSVGCCGYTARCPEAKSSSVDPARPPVTPIVAPAPSSRMFWSPQMSCRAVNRTPVPVPSSPMYPARDPGRTGYQEKTAFAVKPPSPPSRMRNVSPAAFSRPLQDSDMYVGTPVVAVPRS